MRVSATAVCSLLVIASVSSCIDAPLSKADLDERIDTESKRYPTPSLLADCLHEACADNTNDCQKSCFAGASAAAKPIGEKLWQCWKATCHEDLCKTSVDPACMNQCLITRCGPEVVAAVNSASTDTRSCADTLRCMDKCDAKKPGMFACFADCFSRTSPIGQSALIQVAACSAQNDGDVKNRCQTQLVACHSATDAATGKCYTFAPCIETCTGDKIARNACYQACRDKLDDNAKKNFDALVPCFEGSELGKPKCRAALISCLEPSGEDTCLRSYQCHQKCQAAVGEADKTGCFYSCLHNSTDSSVHAALDLASCSDGAPGKCEAALLSCAEPAGTGSCPDITPCVNTCMNGDQGLYIVCVLQCMQTATKPAATAYGQLLACVLPCQDKCGTKQSCADSCLGKCNKQQNTCKKT